jgi:hypothetical protein
MGSYQIIVIMTYWPVTFFTMDINQLNPKHMCQNCIDQIRIQLTESNDQEKLEKLAIIEEGSKAQEKATGVGLEGFEIVMSLMLPLPFLKESIEEYKKKQVVLKQMQQN